MLSCLVLFFSSPYLFTDVWNLREDFILIQSGFTYLFARLGSKQCANQPQQAIG